MRPIYDTQAIADLIMFETIDNANCLLKPYGLKAMHFRNSEKIGIYTEKDAEYICTIEPMKTGHITPNVTKDLRMDNDEVESIVNSIRKKQKTLSATHSDTINTIRYSQQKQMIKERIREKARNPTVCESLTTNVENTCANFIQFLESLDLSGSVKEELACNIEDLAIKCIHEVENVYKKETDR